MIDFLKFFIKYSIKDPGSVITHSGSGKQFVIMDTPAPVYKTAACEKKIEFCLHL